MIEINVLVAGCGPAGLTATLALAILDEAQEPAEGEGGLELRYCPSACLPQAWVERVGEPVSTLDLIGRRRFALLTGIGGDAWSAAADVESARFGIEIAVTAIGPGCEVSEPRFEWHDRRGIAESGGPLVRPDCTVAWRCERIEGEQTTCRLPALVASLLGR